MSNLNRLDAATSRALLHKASQKNTSLDLVRLLEKGADPCRTRFLEAPDLGLTVEVPSRQGHMVPVRAGEEVDVFFRLNENRYFFHGQIKARSQVRLSAQVALPVLVLTTPACIEKRQRRKNYRVNMGVTKPLKARISLMPSDTDAVQAPPAPPAPLPDMEVLDLSAGGMRLFLESAAQGPVGVGDHLAASFELAPGGAAVQVTGRVQYVSRVADQSLHIGIQFTGLTESFDGCQLHTKLTRFVAKRDREELRRARHAQGG